MRLGDFSFSLFAWIRSLIFSSLTGQGKVWDEAWGHGVIRPTFLWPLETPCWFLQDLCCLCAIYFQIYNVRPSSGLKLVHCLWKGSSAVISVSRPLIYTARSWRLHLNLDRHWPYTNQPIRFLSSVLHWRQACCMTDYLPLSTYMNSQTPTMG